MSFFRALIILTVAIGANFWSGISPAAVGAPFTQEAFLASQNEGKPVLVDIAASWCPTCKAQHPVIESLLKQPGFENFVVFSVDFDSQKDVVRFLGAQRQSTLIVYRGKEEKGRSTGDTNADSIKALLEQAN